MYLPSAMTFTNSLLILSILLPPSFFGFCWTILKSTPDSLSFHPYISKSIVKALEEGLCCIQGVPGLGVGRPEFESLIWVFTAVGTCSRPVFSVKWG